MLTPYILRAVPMPIFAINIGSVTDSHVKLCVSWGNIEGPSSGRWWTSVLTGYNRETLS